MILCTGRTPGDTPALPSFKARTNTVASRLDHVLVDPDLFSSIQSCCIGPVRDDSDHMPLEMRILLSAAAPPSPPPHLCNITPQPGSGMGPNRSHTPLPFRRGHARLVCNRALRLPLLVTCPHQIPTSTVLSILQLRWRACAKLAAQALNLRACQATHGLTPNVLRSGPSCAVPKHCLHAAQRSGSCNVAIKGSSGAARWLAITGMLSSEHQSSPVLAPGQLAIHHAASGALDACCMA